MSMHRIPEEFGPGAARKHSGPAYERHNSIAGDVLDPDWRVTTFMAKPTNPPSAAGCGRFLGPDL